MSKSWMLGFGIVTQQHDDFFPPFSQIFHRSFIFGSLKAPFIFFRILKNILSIKSWKYFFIPSTFLQLFIPSFLKSSQHYIVKKKQPNEKYDELK